MKQLNLTEKQNLLNALHNQAMIHLQQYASGLITLPELTKEIDSLNKVYSLRIESMSGLLCPNTGLKFS